jgi:hypothetical protein
MFDKHPLGALGKVYKRRFNLSVAEPFLGDAKGVAGCLNLPSETSICRRPGLIADGS